MTKYHPLDAVPWWLIESCRNRWYLRSFVETGTGYGETALHAADLFETVYTVELLNDVYDRQLTAVIEHPSIKRFQGDSRDWLPVILNACENTPTLWYLDAHWTAIGERPTAEKQKVECPLLEELDVILTKGKLSFDVVMIDNAGMFFNPPIPPHDPRQWPSMPDIVQRLRRMERPMLIQWFADVLVVTPEPLWGEF